MAAIVLGFDLNRPRAQARAGVGRKDRRSPQLLAAIRKLEEIAAFDPGLIGVYHDLFAHRLKRIAEGWYQ